jgi:hypothetical protein
MRLLLMPRVRCIIPMIYCGRQGLQRIIEVAIATIGIVQVTLIDDQLIVQSHNVLRSESLAHAEAEIFSVDILCGIIVAVPWSIRWHR